MPRHPVRRTSHPLISVSGHPRKLRCTQLQRMPTPDERLRRITDGVAALRSYHGSMWNPVLSVLEQTRLSITNIRSHLKKHDFF